MKTHNFIISFLDTDSIAFSKPDGSPFSEEEQLMLLADLNSNFPPKIRFEHDGVFSSVVILKAKNYILNQNGKLTKKGSSLKSSKTEPRMKDFMGEVIDLLISNNKQEVINVYNKYCKEILTLTDITPYCSKKTITTSVVNPSRTNEQKVLDALHGQQVSMGDKIYLYYAEETREETYVKYRTDRKTKEKIEVGTATRIVTEFPLRLREEWNVNAPDHSVDKLLKRLYDTLIIFKNVINIDEVPKYYQKGHKAELEKMVTNGI